MSSAKLGLASARGRRCRLKKKRKPFWSIATKVTESLLGCDETVIRPFRDFVLTEIIHCQTRKLAQLGDSAAIASAARRCLRQHTLPLLRHMPDLKWIVAVSKSTERLLLSDGVLEEVVAAGETGRGLPSPTRLPAPNDKIKWLAAGDRLRVVFTPFLGCGQWRKSYCDALREIPCPLAEE